MDYELLKKRREKYLELQRELGEEQHIGLGYVLTVEGKQYPVLSCFSVSEDVEEAKKSICDMSQYSAVAVTNKRINLKRMMEG